MPQSIANRVMTTPDETLVIGRPRMAKAEWPETTALSAVVKEAARRAHGKQEAAARHLGKNPGNFSRDVDAGRVTVRDLEGLGAPFLAELGKELVEQFSALTDPKSEARRALADLERARDVLRQFVDVA